jgi:hypothetical protein
MIANFSVSLIVEVTLAALLVATLSAASSFDRRLRHLRDQTRSFRHGTRSMPRLPQRRQPYRIARRRSMPTTPWDAGFRRRANRRTVALTSAGDGLPPIESAQSARRRARRLRFPETFRAVRWGGIR